MFTLLWLRRVKVILPARHPDLPMRARSPVVVLPMDVRCPFLSFSAEPLKVNVIRRRRPCGRRRGRCSRR
jgi:hypothetical protein